VILTLDGMTINSLKFHAAISMLQ